MDTLQRKNIEEIKSLNQRGGRILTFVDLVKAGTLTETMIAYCWTAIAHGASFMTAARPSGAGKSTVLANMLALLPPDEEIITYKSDNGVAQNGAKQCQLVHEIGPGHYYGYIWGKEVAEFFNQRTAGQCIATCIHADTYEDLNAILTSPTLKVTPDLLQNIDILVFIHLTPDYKRRIASAWEATGEGHRRIGGWDAHRDVYELNGPWTLLERLGATESEYRRYLSAVHRIVEEGDDLIEDVRWKVLEAYGA